MFDNNNIQKKLGNSALFITSYEILTNVIIENLKGFLCDNELRIDDEHDLVFIVSEEYRNTILNKKHDELNNQKNEFYACCQWHLNENVINQMDFNKLQEIRKYRNTLSHNFVNILLDENKTIGKSLLEDLIRILEKIGVYWFKMNTQICYPEMDKFDEKVNIVSVSLIQMLEKIVNQK